MTRIREAVACLAWLGMAGCAIGPPPSSRFDPSSLPVAVRAPAGHAVALEAVGVGEIIYECRPNPGMRGVWEWAAVGPEAELTDRLGRPIGRHRAQPATWEGNDGSSVTGVTVALVPAGAANIPLQLVKASATRGNGVMQGVTYVQRVATTGGRAPDTACRPTLSGQRQVRKFQAEYIFYKAT